MKLEDLIRYITERHEYLRISCTDLCLWYLTNTVNMFITENTISSWIFIDNIYGWLIIMSKNRRVNICQFKWAIILFVPRISVINEYKLTFWFFCFSVEWRCPMSYWPSRMCLFISKRWWCKSNLHNEYYCFHCVH